MRFRSPPGSLPLRSLPFSASLRAYRFQRKRLAFGPMYPWRSSSTPPVRRITGPSPPRRLRLVELPSPTPASPIGTHVIDRTEFTGTTSSSTTATLGNRIDNLVFSSTIYGDAFDSRTLAITASPGDSGIIGYAATESDVIVNTGYTWNSYRVPCVSRLDLRRVLVHEFGHVLGFDHPDQADPVQSVAAIMNGTVSGIDSLQADDRDGAAALYNVPITKPVITTQPRSATVDVASPAAFTVAVDGAPVPPRIRSAPTNGFSPRPAAPRLRNSSRSAIQRGSTSSRPARRCRPLLFLRAHSRRHGQRRHCYPHRQPHHRLAHDPTRQRRHPRRRRHRRQRHDRRLRHHRHEIQAGAPPRRRPRARRLRCPRHALPTRSSL